MSIIPLFMATSSAFFNEQIDEYQSILPIFYFMSKLNILTDNSIGDIIQGGIYKTITAHQQRLQEESKMTFVGIKNGPTKFCYIMRGIPGSGKSTVANRLAHQVIIPSAIHSTDKYFMVDGVYKFDPTKLREYHQKNLEAFKKSLDELPSLPFYEAVVICDNTNIKKSQYQPYVDAAKAAGYCVAFVVMPMPEAEIAAARNKHGVPLEVIKRMIEQWES